MKYNHYDFTSDRSNVRLDRVRAFSFARPSVRDKRKDDAYVIHKYASSIIYGNCIGEIDGNVERSIKMLSDSLIFAQVISNLFERFNFNLLFQC